MHDPTVNTTASDATLVQPLLSVTCTVKDPGNDELTACVVDPSDQRYEVKPAGAVKLTGGCDGHTVVAEALTTGFVGSAFTITAVASEFGLEQLFVSVMLTL